MGQDLVKMELGGSPQSGETEHAGQEPKAPAPDSQATSSDPVPSNEDGESKVQPPSTKEPSSRESKQEAQLSQPKSEPTQTGSPRKDQQTSKPTEPKKTEGKKISNDGTLGSRDERRACNICLPLGNSD